VALLERQGDQSLRTHPFQSSCWWAFLIYLLVHFSEVLLFLCCFAYMFSGLAARAAYSAQRRPRAASTAGHRSRTSQSKRRKNIATNASKLRIAIVGAASLRGKELNEALGESPLPQAEFVLMDDQEAIGQLEAVGDEVTLLSSRLRLPPLSGRLHFFYRKCRADRKHWRPRCAPAQASSIFGSARHREGRGRAGAVGAGVREAA